MISFYQDFSGGESNNKEIKPIEIQGEFIKDLSELQKNREFKKVLSKTFRL